MAWVCYAKTMTVTRRPLFISDRHLRTSRGAATATAVTTMKAPCSLQYHRHHHFFLATRLPLFPAWQGGSSILEAMRGAEDITPVFESYHALADTASIRRSLEKFEWTGKVGQLSVTFVL